MTKPKEAIMNDTARYPAIIAELSREFTRWATEDLERHTLEDLCNETGAINNVTWAQLGYTSRNLDEAQQELAESGECPELNESACSDIACELDWNHSKVLYSQLQHVAANGFTEHDIALWRSVYGWSKHAEKLLARAERVSDAVNPRNAIVSLDEAVKISCGEDEATPAVVKLIQAARAKYNA